MFSKVVTSLLDGNPPPSFSTDVKVEVKRPLIVGLVFSCAILKLDFNWFPPARISSNSYALRELGRPLSTHFSTASILIQRLLCLIWQCTPSSQNPFFRRAWTAFEVSPLISQYFGSFTHFMTCLILWKNSHLNQPSLIMMKHWRRFWPLLFGCLNISLMLIN